MVQLNKTAGMLVSRSTFLFVLFFTQIFTQLFAQNSFAIGTIQYEGWSFLKSADDRGNAAQMFIGGPEYQGRGKFLESRLDPKVYAFMATESAYTGEAKNFYVASSTQLSPLHQGTLGRRQYDWSQMDEVWKMGVWSPRFLWDPLNPETVGLTGSFYTYQSKNWRAMAFASPLSIPERGFPTQDSDGKITSASPYSTQLPQNVRVNGKLLPMKYSVNLPPMGDILVRPEAAIGTRYQPKSGMWGGINYGYMPIHQPDVTIDAGLRAVAKQVEIDIYPRFPMHHLLTAETGYRADFFEVWASVSGEKPEAPENIPNYLYRPMGPSLITSWGGVLKMQQGLSLHTSYFRVTEDQPALTSTSATTIDLPGRYAYSKAWMFGGAWQPTDLLTYSANWTYDVEKVSSLFSTDILFKKPLAALSSWAVGVGIDLINTSSGEGWVGQYEGNDRIRGKLIYAF